MTDPILSTQRPISDEFRRRRRMGIRTAAVIGGLALIVLASACGNSSTTAAAGSTGTTAGDGNRQAYRDCLAQNGVTLPQRGNGTGGPPGTDGAGTFDPNAGSGDGRGGAAGAGPGGGTIPGVDQATMQKAQDACKDLRPAGGNGGFGGGGGQGAAGGTAFAAYASCMQDHGVTIRGGRGGSTDTTAADTTPPSTVDRSSAAFKAANDACKALLPAQGQGDPSTTSTTAP